MSEIAVIDCQASWEVYTDRFRELFDSPEIYFAPEDEFPDDPDKVVITGSTSNLSSNKSWMKELIERTREYIEAGTPVLGICFGMQVINRALGGEVKEMDDWEIGYEPVEFTDSRNIEDGVENPFSVHREEVVSIPEDLKVTARSDKCVQAIEHIEKPVYGVQFHPELTPEICRKSISSKDIAAERKQELLSQVNSHNFDRAKRCLKIIENFKNMPLSKRKDVRKLVDTETSGKI